MGSNLLERPYGGAGGSQHYPCRRVRVRAPHADPPKSLRKRSVTDEFVIRLRFYFLFSVINPLSLSKKFTFGLIWNIIGKTMMGIFGAIISILIARKLGKTELGLYASILTIPTTLRPFTSLGFETILNVKLPVLNTLEDSIKKMRFLIRKLFLYRIVIIFATAVLLYFAMPLLQGFFKNVSLPQYIILIIFYLGALMIFSYVTMIFRALLRIKLVSIIEGISQLINLLLLILFFAMGFKIAAVLSAFIISSLLTTFILIFLGKDYIFGDTSPMKLNESYEIGAAAVLGAFIAFGLGTQVDIIIMNYFNVPSEEIGFYFLCFSLASMMMLLLQGIGALSQSVFSEQYSKKGNSGLALSWSMVTQVSILLSIPIYIFAIFNAKTIIEILYGGQFSAVAVYFKIFASFGCITTLGGAAFCMPVFYLLRRKKLALKIQLAGGILNIVLNIILIPKYGVWGVVLATGFSRALGGVIQMLFVRYYINAEFPLIFELKLLFACLIALIPTVLVEGSDIIAFLLKMIVYGFGLVALLFLLKPLSEKAKAFVESTDKRIFAFVRFF